MYWHAVGVVGRLTADNSTAGSTGRSCAPPASKPPPTSTDQSQPNPDEGAGTAPIFYFGRRTIIKFLLIIYNAQPLWAQASGKSLQWIPITDSFCLSLTWNSTNLSLKWFLIATFHWEISMLVILLVVSRADPWGQWGHAPKRLWNMFWPPKRLKNTN